MPDEVHPKRPVPWIPDAVSFIRPFGDHAACALNLKDVCWDPNLERFVCPDCGHGRGWWLPPGNSSTAS